ncbi:hypothetical protein C2G38_2212505 [Gigaspora rosea]|uniref:Uncharacterized protein n=1 Tax=Gigaspora rosea TaxID=44941 RepID=A0A397UGA6_9GLOM|nr:hypothetical protein C2G38_2212505 [Gigaspora rosea]
MADQIIREARIIDKTRGNNSFTNVFAESHNIRYSPKQLEYLEKRTSLFLLNFFVNVYKNIGGSKAISSDTSSKPKAYKFPMLKTQVDIDIMSMAWNTARIPRNDRFCDFEDCIDSKSDKKAKKKDSDNSEVIEASDDTRGPRIIHIEVIFKTG